MYSFSGQEMSLLEKLRPMSIYKNLAPLATVVCSCYYRGLHPCVLLIPSLHMKLFRVWDNHTLYFCMLECIDGHTL